MTSTTQNSRNALEFVLDGRYKTSNAVDTRVRDIAESALVSLGLLALRNTTSTGWKIGYMNIKQYPLRTIVSSICLSVALAACGGKDDKGGIQENITTAIGVNGYLWRASLDTLAFLPMAQVDVGGGIIISDWYLNPDIPGERIKVSVFISDRTLRSDALQVNVHRQTMSGSNWVAAETRAGTVLQLEDAILNRARDLRIRSLDDE